MNHYSFEKLTVWQQARQLANLIYRLTSTYPSEEKFGIVRQLRRSAISVCSNIAEGSTRWNQRDKARFYEIAFGSLIELLNQLILSNDLGYLSDSNLIHARVLIDSIGRMLNALYNSALTQSRTA